MTVKPWDDHSDLEHHFCHKHEIWHDEDINAYVCEICQEAKTAAHIRKQLLKHQGQLNER
jgi:hypothetical protein